ncbi:hypothetical protein quinque_009047 [Culex quinquefasciatus]
MNVGREEPILQRRSFTYISLVVLSVGVCLYILQQNDDQNQHIQDLRENLGSLTKHVLNIYGHDEATPETGQLARRRDFREQVTHELQEALRSIDVLQNRVDFLEKINYDKFGRVDFASADLGGKVVSVEPRRPGFFLWTVLERTMRLGRFGPANRKCCIVQYDCAGKCHAFPGSSGSITLRLMGKVFIEGVSVEHVPKNMLPDTSASSAIREFSVRGLDALHEDGDTFLFGNYLFDSEVDFIQYFNFTLRSSIPFEFVRIKVASNNGADYTCIHRFRVHGKLASSKSKSP